MPQLSPINQTEYLVLTYMFLTQIPSKIAMLKHQFLEFEQANSKDSQSRSDKIGSKAKDQPKNIGQW